MQDSRRVADADPRWMSVNWNQIASLSAGVDEQCFSSVVVSDQHSSAAAPIIEIFSDDSSLRDPGWAVQVITSANASKMVWSLWDQQDCKSQEVITNHITKFPMSICLSPSNKQFPWLQRTDYMQNLQTHSTSLYLYVWTRRGGIAIRIRRVYKEELIRAPADEVVRLVQLLLLRSPGPGGPAGGGRGSGGRSAAARGLGRRERHRHGTAGDDDLIGGGRAVVERAESVVPPAQPRLVLERLHRAHARRHHQRRRLLAHGHRRRCAHLNSLLAPSLMTISVSPLDRSRTG